MAPNQIVLAQANFKGLLRDLLLLSLSALLFALANPNPLLVSGFGPAGFVALLPALWVLKRARAATAVAYGAFFGWSSYALFNYWLAVFNPMAWVIVPFIYLVYHLALFPLLSLALKWERPWTFWVAAAVWTAYEYLRTQGFLGYGYGILGYTQYEFLPWIQSADLGGVWLTTWLTVLPAFAVVQVLGRARATWPWKNLVGLGLLVVANLAYGIFSPLNVEGLPKWKVSLIQHDMDPRRGGLPEYRRGFERLRDLTRSALEDGPEAVVWSETAFFPSIEYHRRHRENPDTWRLVKELLDFLEAVPVPVILGNGHGTRHPAPGGWERRDANAALHYEGGELRGIYRKVHLVPFIEHFPYRDLMPWFYDFLQSNDDVFFWDAGKEWTLFDVRGVQVAPPVCFEDTFGYIGREFTLAGADVFVNLTNDSWSGSRSSMRQHLAIAVFRSVENRRSMVRATNGGWTAAIDPNGRITAELKPMTTGWLTAEVPLVPRSLLTLYTLWGDWLGMVFAAFSLLFFAYLLRRRLTKGPTWATMVGKDGTK